MMSDFTEKFFYIFKTGSVLNALLAVVAVVAFYFVFVIFFSLRKIAKGEKYLIAVSERNLRLVKVFATSAPLIGLLGTVIGITQSISAVDNSEKLAEGVSFALLTTQTGLVIAIPLWIITILLAVKLSQLKLKFL